MVIAIYIFMCCLLLACSLTGVVKPGEESLNCHELTKIMTRENREINALAKEEFLAKHDKQHNKDNKISNEPVTATGSNQIKLGLDFNTPQVQEKMKRLRHLTALFHKRDCFFNLQIS